MRERCRNKNRHNYDRYAERDIGICERWDSFDNFISDMGERPDGMTLDRIDNSKGYYPENCQWATVSQQNKNRVMPKRRKDRTGQKINSLVFLSYINSTKDTSYWLVACDCGNKVKVSSRNVVRGYKKSCGCMS